MYNISASSAAQKVSAAREGRSHATEGPEVLPDQLLLGLRLTVGEDQVTKPHPPSKMGRGHFPDMDPTAPGKDNYYPSFAAYGE